MNKKVYIRYRPLEVYSMNAMIIQYDELDEWLKDGSIEDGDEIYEAKKIFVAKQKTEIVLEKVP